MWNRILPYIYKRFNTRQMSTDWIVRVECCNTVKRQNTNASPCFGVVTFWMLKEHRLCGNIHLLAATDKAYNFKIYLNVIQIFSTKPFLTLYTTCYNVNHLNMLIKLLTEFKILILDSLQKWSQKCLYLMTVLLEPWLRSLCLIHKRNKPFRSFCKSRYSYKE